MLSEKAVEVLEELNKYLPDWADFIVKQYGRIYQATIVIESNYFKPFKITTESTCLENALIQILDMLKIYWIYKEDESEEINQIVKDLEKENII